MESVNEAESDRVVHLTPHVGMEFDTTEDAWHFWREYGGNVGFHVRKYFKNEKVKGEITSRGFVCGNEGYREIDKRNREIKKPRAETRTGCPVRLFVRLIRETKRYQVYEFFGDHNHPLQRPEAVGLIPSQRVIPESYGVSIDLADDAGVRAKDGYALMAEEAGGTQNLLFRKRDYANRVRNKRQRSLAFGEGPSMLRYFSTKSLENSSFRHAEQRDKDGKITNVFWADAKMLIDYGQFGDVITFDTTYGTNKEFRPLGVFVGFNHFREIVVFGATLLYNESIDSFKWLFETFLATHNFKHPITIFTDQAQAMAVALKEVMPNTYHGLCTWHIGQNAIKNLTSKRKNEPDTKLIGKEVLKTFKACLYEYEDEKEFKDAFNSMLSKVRVANDATGEGLSNVTDELEGNNGSNVSGVVNMIFEIFQHEWELSLSSFVKSKSEGQTSTQYTIGVSSFGSGSCPDKFFQVVADHTHQMVSCSCNKFKRWGILCGHALKVLDLMDIKFIPERYILKRWTQDARSDMVEDCSGRPVVENPKLDVMRRYRAHARKLLNLAAIAANYEEVSDFLDSATNALSKEVHDQIQSLLRTETDRDDTCAYAVSKEVTENLDQNLVVLKKTIGKKRKSSKRLTSWVDDRPNKQKISNKNDQNQRTTPFSQPNQISKELEMHNSFVSMLPSEHQDHEHIKSYVELLAASSVPSSSLFSHSWENASMIKDKDVITSEVSTPQCDEDGDQ